jgi:O-succinylbenzoic acid--CoA ligase
MLVELVGTSRLLLAPAIRPTIRRHSTACAYADPVNRPLRTVPATPGDVPALLAALRAALDGTGPAVRPVAGAAAAADHQPDQIMSVPDEVALVVQTSGSTGEPRLVMLSAAALRASAAATDARLGGPGQWLLTLPASHVAGLQVLSRSILAGTEPVVGTPGGFRPDLFAADAARLSGHRRHVSLVPTQLHRLLDDDGAGLAALVRFDAVLLGGAATSPALLARAQAAGVRVTATYGMTETCGGCVYDGAALDGVRVQVEGDGRVLVAGPVLASGYLGRPDLDAQAFADRGGTRWLRTSDLGQLRDGRLTVLGRLDDLLLTGGVLISPIAVEHLLAQLPGVREVCVVGVLDAEWGQSVTAVVVPVAGAPVPTLASVRTHITRSLGSAAAPRRLVLIDRLPVRGPGKTDRRAVAELATARLS